MAFYYEIEIESDSDWHAVELKSGGWWTKQKGKKLTFGRDNSQEFPPLMGLKITDTEVRVHKKTI